jgi:hypothetical protein
MAISNTLPHQNKSAFVLVDIVTEEEREADKKSGEEQEYLCGIAVEKLL